MYVSRKKIPNEKMIVIRGRGKFENVSVQMIFDQIFYVDKRMEWETIFGEMKVLDAIEKDCDLFYFTIKTPWGITTRDFLQRRAFRRDYPQKGQIMIQFKSTESPLMPERKNHIRAETIISGYLIYPDPDNPHNSYLELLS